MEEVNSESCATQESHQFSNYPAIYADRIFKYEFLKANAFRYNLPSLQISN